jgi:hypothetical protein
MKPIRRRSVLVLASLALPALSAAAFSIAKTTTTTRGQTSPIAVAGESKPALEGDPASSTQALPSATSASESPYEAKADLQQGLPRLELPNPPLPAEARERALRERFLVGPPHPWPPPSTAGTEATPSARVESQAAIGPELTATRDEPAAVVYAPIEPGVKAEVEPTHAAASSPFVK